MVPAAIAKLAFCAKGNDVLRSLFNVFLSNDGLLLFVIFGSHKA